MMSLDIIVHTDSEFQTSFQLVAFHFRIQRIFVSKATILNSKNFSIVHSRLLHIFEFIIVDEANVERSDASCSDPYCENSTMFYHCIAGNSVELSALLHFVSM